MFFLWWCMDEVAEVSWEEALLYNSWLTHHQVYVEVFIECIFWNILLRVNCVWYYWHFFPGFFHCFINKFIIWIFVGDERSLFPIFYLLIYLFIDSGSNKNYGYYVTPLISEKFWYKWSLNAAQLYIKCVILTVWRFFEKIWKIIKRILLWGLLRTH